MNISGVDFPTDLLKALRDSDLVVFAGAGVSMGPPASLPNFSGLAKEVAAGTGEVRGEDEPEDRFLGRLQHNGVLVKERIPARGWTQALGDISSSEKNRFLSWAPYLWLTKQEKPSASRQLQHALVGVSGSLWRISGR